jgi:hypothetical protein
MLEEIKNINGSKKDLRNFGLLIGLILVLLGGVLFWKEKASYFYFLVIGFILVGTGIFVPTVNKPIYQVWMTFANMIGWIMTRVVLAILYYLVVMPIGIAARLFGKQFLELKWERTQTSYWNLRETDTIEKRDYEKQF